MKDPNWQKCLLKADSREVIKRIPDNAIDFILTDPPYNIGKHSTGNIPLPGRTAMNNDVADWDWVDFHPEEWADEFIRILKPTGNLFIFTSYNQLGRWYECLDHKFDTSNFMIWHKTNPAPKIFKAGFLNSCEMIFTCWNKRHTWNFEDIENKINNINLKFLEILLKYYYYVTHTNEINKLDIIYYYFYDRQGIKRIISSNEYELVDVNHNGIYKKAVNYTVQEIINENNLFYILDEDGNKINTMENAEKYLVHSSVVKNINSFIDFYSTDINIPYNKYLYNRIHLLDLFVYKNDELVQLQYNVNDYEDEAFMEIKINNKIYKIGQNTSEDIYELYNKIFDENGDWTSRLYGIKKSIDDVVFTQNEQNEYDFYLMHDTEYWYGIMISKYTINSLNLYDLPYKTYRMNFHDNSVNNEVLNENMIYLKLNKSNDVFLINRMEFIDCNGINQFNNTDFVVAKIINNDRLPIKSELDSKWTIKPLSIGIDNFGEFKSNTNMMLMSIGDNLKYEPGYYEIIVKYSIDNFTNEIYSKSTKFKIIK